MDNSTNVSAEEIKKFESLAHDWWNPHGNCKPLHDINPLRLDYIKQYTHWDNQKILDIGCGGGILSESMAKQNAHVTGIDMSETLIHIAKQHSLENKLTIDYQCISAEELSQQKAQSYDIITCMELLEHVPDPEALVYTCAKLIKPDGKLFFSTINRNLKAYLFAILGAEYILKLLPKGTHDYAKFIRPSELAAWIRAAKLTLQDIAGMRYNVFTHQYQLTKDSDVNYLVYCTS